jgi:prepilin-type processing-associated H-X9-DG protein
MKRLRAFEILLVLGVLVVLIALLVPRVPPRHEASRLTMCLNNLKQLGKALKMYSQDFGERYPWHVGVSNPAEAWRDLALLFPSYDSGWDSFRCPSSKDQPFEPKSASGDKRDYPFEPLLPANTKEAISYAYGLDARDPANPTAWTEEAPSTTRLLADKKAGVGLTERSNHKTDGRNVLYQDGHVQWKSGTAALDPDETNDEVGPPQAPDAQSAPDYRAWWSDPPYYGE